jgi:cytochrome c5
MINKNSIVLRVVVASLMFGSASVLTSTFADDAKVNAARVQELYTAHCASCHADGKQGAPITGKIEDWGERLMAGVDGLLAATKKGLKTMPANGGCNACSDAELQALIEWMAEDRAPQKN